MGSAPRRLLVLGMHNSPHLHRWTRMIARPDLSILVFPVLSFAPPLPGHMQYVEPGDLAPDLPAGIRVVRPPAVGTPERRDERYQPWTHSFVDPKLLPPPERLIATIRSFRPGALHAMETQIAGYLCAETARRLGNEFPPWIQSTWGSDLALFRKLPGHAPRLRAVFERVMVHLSDGARDHALAREFGYRGPVVPPIPSSGGMDIDDVASLAAKPPSERRTIIVKGYHNWAGRGLLGLSALMLARESLGDYRIAVLVPGAAFHAWREQAEAAIGAPVELLNYVPEHRKALAQLSQARIVIGLSISDGTPTTMLEAMAVGAFPIQSSTGCADEWLEHGRSGLIVSPHDTREIAEAVTRALGDDALVDEAAKINLETVRRRWDLATNAALVWDIYDRVFTEAGL